MSVCFVTCHLQLESLRQNTTPLSTPKPKIPRDKTSQHTTTSHMRHLKLSNTLCRSLENLSNLSSFAIWQTGDATAPPGLALTIPTPQHSATRDHIPLPIACAPTTVELHLPLGRAQEPALVLHSCVPPFNEHPWHILRNPGVSRPANACPLAVSLCLSASCSLPPLCRLSS